MNSNKTVEAPQRDPFAGMGRLRKLGRRDRKKRLKMKQATRPVNPAYKIMWSALRLLGQNWKLYGGILLIYLLLLIIFVKGIPGNTLSLSMLRENISQVYQKGIGKDFALLGLLIGSTGTASSEQGTVYQSLIVLIVSLVLIWALRQSMAGRTVRIRDAFYRGVAPLVTFLLVLAVVALQCIPFLAASLLFSIVTGSGLAVGGFEQALWIVILLFGSALSLYFVSGSVFALYIVTLPNMTPVRALKSAYAAVRYRRMLVLRKFLFLPVAILAAAAGIIMPLIIFATGAAEIAYLLVTVVALAVVHAYLYALYRELI